MAFIDDFGLFDPVRKVGSADAIDVRAAAWMARDDVRKALHVDWPKPKHSLFAPWPGPVDGWSYQSQWGACNVKAAPGTPSMVDLYRLIAPQLEGDVLIYSGDADPCVAYEGTREAVRKVMKPNLAFFLIKPKIPPPFLSKPSFLFLFLIKPHLPPFF